MKSCLVISLRLVFSSSTLKDGLRASFGIVAIDEGKHFIVCLMPHMQSVETVKRVMNFLGVPSGGYQLFNLAEATS